MNFFSKIFRSTHTNSVNAMNQNDHGQRIENQNIDSSVTEDLFVDKQEPSPEVENNAKEVISVQSFLEQDFYGSGYRDGYNYHSAEMMNNRIKGLKATFRFRLDLAIDQKRKSLLELRTHNIELDGLSERMIRKIDVIEEDYRGMITRLEKEKDLSADEEGWVMKPIHEYRDGFIRGAESYNEEKLIAKSTGLFN